MRFDFDVGQGERHRVTFSFNKFWGTLLITVDGQPVVKDLRTASLRLVKTYQFPVGMREQHTVRIDKERKLLFAGFRPQRCRAYVDGQLVAEAVG